MPGGSGGVQASARCLRRSARRWTARRAARTSARTAPATSSRWCTTASSTPTCSSSPRPTTCSGRAPACARPDRRDLRTWNTGRLDSYLIEITAEVLDVDASTGKPFVDIVLDEAEQKGTGRWTVQDALDLGVPVSGIAEEVFSRRCPARRTCAAPPGARPVQYGRRGRPVADQVEQALYASKIVAYAQGWHMMPPAARSTTGTSTWADRQIWRGGCIIRRVLGPHGPPTRTTPNSPRCWSTTTSARSRRRPGRLAAVGTAVRPASRCPASRPPWPTTTRCGPACPPPSSRACATSSARTPTAVRTATARSIPSGPRTAPRNPAKNLNTERACSAPSTRPVPALNCCPRWR